MGRVDLLEKTPTLKDWGQEEQGVTENEMVGWHHWLSGNEFEQAPRASAEQGNLECCSPWGLQRVGHTLWTEQQQQRLALEAVASPVSTVRSEGTALGVSATHNTPSRLREDFGVVSSPDQFCRMSFDPSAWHGSTPRLILRDSMSYFVPLNRCIFSFN